MYALKLLILLGDVVLLAWDCNRSNDHVTSKRVLCFVIVGFLALWIIIVQRTDESLASLISEEVACVNVGNKLRAKKIGVAHNHEVIKRIKPV